MVNESHAQRWRDRTLRTILAKMRQDGCGGIAAKAGLLTGIEGVSARPVLRGGCNPPAVAVFQARCGRGLPAHDRPERNIQARTQVEAS
jgi:hypothetical protein